MNVSARQREAVRRGADLLGLTKHLSKFYERIEPAARRDRIDNDHMRLLIAFWLHEDANCIDIGAHSGTILREMVRCAPSGRHIAYEPLPAFAAKLSTEFPQVDVRNAALSNIAGTATFFLVNDDPMQSGLHRRTGADPSSSTPIPVRIDRLDDSLPEGYAPTLIKIDVEGGERQVLEGALDTISRHSPVVCFEHGPGAESEYDTTPESVYDLLVDQARMRIFDIDGDGPYSRQQFVETFHRPIWNFIAHR
jgi:FkbM family methyltransferase